jgi:uncharacterized protein DUF5330
MRRDPQRRQKALQTSSVTSENSTGRVMFFLLRVAFWIIVALALLPTGSSQPTAQAAKFGTTDAVLAATATVSDMSAFCERQPEACKVGAQAAVVIGQRAQAGAKMVYEFISDRVVRGDGDRDATTGSVVKPVTVSESQNTLTAADREPAWQGPPTRTEAVPLPRPRKGPPNA